MCFVIPGRSRGDFFLAFPAREASGKCLLSVPPGHLSSRFPVFVGKRWSNFRHMADTNWTGLLNSRFPVFSGSITEIVKEPTYTAHTPRPLSPHRAPHTPTGAIDYFRDSSTEPRKYHGNRMRLITCRIWFASLGHNPSSRHL